MSARRTQAGCSLALLLAMAVAAGAATDKPAAQTHYTLEDFPQVEKIDAHVHVHGVADRFMAQAIADNFRILTIDVDYPDYPPIAEQLRDAISLRQRYPGRVAFATTFSVGDFGSPGWSNRVIQGIDADVAHGAAGVKIWKNIGMTLRDADGHYVMPDDARIEPVIAHLESHHIVLLGHQAEPLNCWLPLEKMTVRGDRDYFREHPQYYMYQHPDMPSHDSILAARDRMLKAHPALRFDSVHLASLEWDVDKVAAFLNHFPHARVDVAARLVHLEYQATTNPDKVRRFLIRYQDRILYGSDDAYGPVDSDPAAVKDVHDGWLQDWRFLVTSDPMHSEDFAASFHGLQLPREVVDKIYRRNAEVLFPKAWDKKSQAAIASVADAAQWETLPPTPTLPEGGHGGYAPVNGIKIWYASYGRGQPVILLHGGLANSSYWGNQVRALAPHYRVIVMDSRGHGRSTRDERPFGYELMAADVLALMDYLKIPEAAVVGWSDGAILGLHIAIHHPERLTKLFAFAANSDPSGVKDVSQSPTFNAYIARAEKEYEKLSSTPKQYASFLEQISKMWATQPHFTADQLRRVSVPIWIVDGDHDEAIKRENTEFMASQIPDAGLLLQPQVSHFSFIQDPTQFDNDVLHFLANVKRH